MLRLIWLVAAFLITFEARSTAAVEIESDCASCHSEAPVPEQHPPVNRISAEACGMCHSNQADDGYFSAVHTAHARIGFDCSSCHAEEATEALQQQLDASGLR